MEKYRHLVQYYETDKMGITHHSNYIRWMEEARVDFLKQIGWPYDRLEAFGIISPVVETHCKYRIPTTFADEVTIEVSVSEFNGVKLVIHYEMTNQEGKKVAEAESAHCFVNTEGKPIRLAKQFPELNDEFLKLAGKE